MYQYDKSSPTAPSLDGFQVSYMVPHVFKDMLRRTFNLKFTPKEFGAVMRHFDKNANNQVCALCMC